MKARNPFRNILAVGIALALAGTGATAATITVIDTFDFPGAGNATLPQKVNDHGLLVGVVINPDGVVRGFLRSRQGAFGNAFAEPNDTGNLTQGRGVNNERLICGEYLNGSDGTFHGYFRKHAIFREFDIADASNTIPLGINNVGNFVGTVILSDASPRKVLSAWAEPSPCSPSQMQPRRLLINLMLQSRSSVTMWTRSEPRMAISVLATAPSPFRSILPIRPERSCLEITMPIGS